MKRPFRIGVGRVDRREPQGDRRYASATSRPLRFDWKSTAGA